MRSRTLPPLLAAVLLVLPASAAAVDRIDTVAGSGNGGFAGDGGAATAALLTAPSDVQPASGGAYLIADTSNHRIRRVAANGTISTVAGAGSFAGGASGFAGDGGPATATNVRLNQPRAVSPTADGGFLIADTLNHVIRRVSPAGVITTVAGTGATSGNAGDGGPATSALLNAPQGVAALPDGGFLVADTGNSRIRRVSAGGQISAAASLASNGAGFSGDGGPATSARLNAPAQVTVLADGGYLVADTGNNRIRRVSSTGTIGTVAGTGVAGSTGDGGPATAATLNQPEGVAARSDGSIVIADSTGERVRVVSATGIIGTLAGTGSLGFSGDGGPPSLAEVSHPRAVSVDGTTLRFADAFNHRIRAITPVTTTTPPDTTPTTTTPPPGVSPPVIGASTVVRETQGRVLVLLPGEKRWVELDGAGNIPIGSQVDTLDGTAALYFVTTKEGRTATAYASQGQFLVGQPNQTDEGQRPGELRITGEHQNCPAKKRRAAAGPRASAAKSTKSGRRVRVKAKGKIKTRGKYGSAIVRGTRWVMVDRCASDRNPGTYVAVQEGVVAVRDFPRHRTVRVKRGQDYLARPPKR